MDYLNKFLRKKTIFMSSFILSAVMIAFRVLTGLVGGGVSMPTDMSDIESLVSGLTSYAFVIQIIFYVLLVVSIALAVLAGFYFFKKDNKDYPMLAHTILWGLNGLFLLLSLSGVNAACGVLSALAAGDYSAILGFSSSLASMTSATQYLTYYGYLVVVVFIIDLALFLVIKKVVQLNNFEYSLEETTSVEGTDVSIDTEKAKELAKGGIDSVKEFIKTKNGKITLGVIGALIALFVGYNVYNNVFNYTTIDVFDTIDIKYYGESGEGRISYVSMGEVEYDRTDSNLASFISSIDFDYDSKTDLKNGDKVTIYAQYDKDEAEEHHFRLKEDTIEVTVEGLTEVYSKASEVPAELVTKVKTQVEESMKKNYVDDNYSKYKYTPSETYFVSSPTRTDYIYMTYILEQTIQYSTGDPTVREMIVAARVYPINSDYLKEEETPYVSISQLSYDKDTSKVEETILNNLNYGSGDYTISKF